MNILRLRHCCIALASMFVCLFAMPVNAAPLNLADTPLFVSSTVPPLSMLVMGRDHKLYYEAYNDASDLNGDGAVDVGYQPSIDYYGYFDSYRCYDYSSSRFSPNGATTDKKCSSVSGSWSGDFLNYITTARIDALRKVLYGGYRSIDSSSLTVLQRTHIPQDAHSWGKEYDPANSPGYLIADYTPLAEPLSGTRHIFASVSLSATGDPLMRVLNDSAFRVWEWLSQERPVAGTKCLNQSVNCATGGGATWQTVPSTVLKNLSRSTYDISGTGSSHPNNHSDYDTWEATYAVPGRLDGTDTMTTLVGTGNPHGADDNYLTIVNGTINVPSNGTYTFAVDGDDAVEFIVKNTALASSGNKLVVGWYGGHGACNCETHTGSVYLLGGQDYAIQYRHEERGGGDSFALRWENTVPSSTITDYSVNVEVCNASKPETNCQIYPNGNYKPTGVLHKYGENESMMFGLLTGSYENNTQGGVLRKQISPLTDEIDSSNGTFTSTVGIIKTIDKFKTDGFNYSSYAYSCGWITGRPINNGECSMWGNPVAEMMYESLRYFSGTGAPLSAFDYGSGSIDAGLGLPKASWNDPYDVADSGYSYCAKPFQLVISDINPSYDSDNIPGSYFSGMGSDSALPGLNARTLADTITAGESDVPGLRYIGQSNAVVDSTPAPKTVTSLGTIRGLAPEEPTKLGSYYAASVAYHGWLSDVSSTTAEPSSESSNFDSRYKQRPNTFSVALASPLPSIKIPVAGGNEVTLVPFAKSPGGAGISSSSTGFQPTNQIVDFYVESLTATEGSFLINFEDVEQGADHDMDAISRYRYKLNADGTVTINVDSIYAAGGIDQHMGYVISGTTKDGVYLEVKDVGGNDVAYFLDTPPGVDAGDSRGSTMLSLSATRTFTPGSASGASLLKDPLWYAAKWGGFIDQNGDKTPDVAAEWDEDGDGDPDNYFLVTNALGLADQLSDAFDEILSRNGSSATVTVNSGSLGTDTLLFQALFDAEQWNGSVLALPIQSDGSVISGSEVWNAKDRIKSQASGAGFSSSREILTYNSTSNQGVPFLWPSNYNSPGATDLGATEIALLLSGVASDQQNYGSDLLDFIRGDASEEQGTSGASRAFRTRDGYVLGDVVHSDPVYVPEPGFFYPDSWEVIGVASAPENAASQKYSDFRNIFKDRKPMLYFGANDGMFHGINAWASTVTGGGNEVLAYVPTPVYKDLPQLARPSYSHRYYVDGPAVYGDAFFDTVDSSWHTVTVGTLRGGGQGVFALDVTDPHGISASYPSFDEGNAADIVLWEFTDADDSDLGYTFGKPSVVRMANGKWVAIFGNGFNNTDIDSNVSLTGNAVIYIVDIEDGSLMAKFDTGVGISDDPTSAGRPNGISEPAPVDIDGDRIVDYIYAGDLFGNVWKFDVTSSNQADWGSYFHSGSVPNPMYVAKDASGNELPITTRPQVSTHPQFRTGHNFMVYFGTGKYMEGIDNASSGELTQTFHGLWDDGTIISGRDKLLQQSITSETAVTDDDGAFLGNFRTVTSNDITWTGASPHRGWALDLLNGASNFGERQVSSAVLRNGRVIFTTLIPSTDICAAGGTGWLMILDTENGGALSESALFTNGTLDSSVGGIQPGGADGGIPSMPAIMDLQEGGNEIMVLGTSTANIVSIEATGTSNIDRMSWREVK